jgi:hypothetical protein
VSLWRNEDPLTQHGPAMQEAQVMRSIRLIHVGEMVSPLTSFMHSGAAKQKIMGLSLF